MLRWSHVEISGGFLLLMALLYYLDKGDLLFWTLLACGLHELGHFAAIRLLGGRVELLRLTCVGAEMRLSNHFPLSGGRELLATVAGPAANLLLALGAARIAPVTGEDFYLFAGLNLALAAFNLLPAAQLDGGRILWHVLTLLGLEVWAGRVVRLLSGGLGAALLVLGLILLLQGSFNVTLLSAALWLILPNIPKGEKKRIFS